MKTMLLTWRVSDQFWLMVEPVIPKPERAPEGLYRRRSGGGRKPIEPRRVFDAILYVLRTGLPWKMLPKEHYGSSSSIHSYFLAWERAGLFDNLWRRGLAEHDDMAGIVWQWYYKAKSEAAEAHTWDAGGIPQGNEDTRQNPSLKKAWRPIVMRRGQLRRSSCGSRRVGHDSQTLHML